MHDLSKLTLSELCELRRKLQARKNRIDQKLLSLETAFAVRIHRIHTATR